MMSKAKWLTVVLCAVLVSGSAFAGSEPKSDFFTTSDDVKIHYYTMGDSGTWVVLIHGFMDTAKRMWINTGIAGLLAENHRVVALDNRNHGQSDKPAPNGPGRAEDVLELMDHLGIEKAHIHGYSMGGGMTGRLLASNPEKFITAGFGGSGIYETNATVREQVATLDPEAPEAEGVAAAAFERLRERAAAARAAAGSEGASSRSSFRAPLEIDLTTIDVPVIAINGEFDRPYSKSHRMWRELKNFTNVVLPGRNHMTAIAVGVPMDETYVREIVKFINAHDE
ncbi:MAG: alpha/beta hydrolase [Candidatus Hydrogenedentes bacterium]|nr:alpha/beta hydrolase [Candidatus Hydrogenedentota bacterium]